MNELEILGIKQILKELVDEAVAEAIDSQPQQEEEDYPSDEGEPEDQEDTEEPLVDYSDEELEQINRMKELDEQRRIKAQAVIDELDGAESGTQINKDDMKAIQVPTTSEVLVKGTITANKKKFVDPGFQDEEPDEDDDLSEYEEKD